MALEDIQIKDPAELNQEMGEAVFEQMFGSEQPQPAQAPQVEAENAFGDPQPEAQAQTEPENAGIRMEKFKSQRDDYKRELEETKLALAKAQGQLEASNNLTAQGDNSDSVDPTEYMSDVERMQYEKIQNLEATLTKLSEVVQNVHNKDVTRDLNTTEENFFKQRPELQAKREEISEKLLDYVKDKPVFAKAVRDGSMSLSELYGAYQAANPQSTRTAQVSNPDQVFSGSSQPAPAQQPRTLDADQEYKKAVSVLKNPDSMNKKQAVKFMESKIADDIISQLDF